MYSQNNPNFMPQIDENQQFEQTSKFNSNEFNENSGEKYQNDILDEGEREDNNYPVEGGSGNAEEEEQMDYENQHFYNENDYTNLQKKHEKQQYEVYEVENNQEDGDEGEGLEESERKINKSPHEKAEEVYYGIPPRGAKNVPVNKGKQEFEGKQQQSTSNQQQTGGNPNELNFHKLQNSKLFQKFLKEEGHPQKSTPIQREEEKFRQKPDFPIPETQYMSNESNIYTVPQRITPLRPKEDPYYSRKSNNEDEKELYGYSQIVPGNVYQPDLVRNNFIQGIPYEYGINPQILMMNNDQYYRSPNALNPLNNEFLPKNYFSPNNSLEIYVAKVNELNTLLTNEMNKNQILEKRCNDYLINLEQVSTEYEELKRKFLQANGNSKIESNQNARYEERINSMNQNMMEQERKMEDLINENENLKKKMENMNSQISYNEEEKRQMLNYIEQIKSTNHDKENALIKRSDETLLLKKSIDNLKNDLFQMKAQKEKLEERIRDLEIQAINSNDDLEFERKKFLDAKDRNKNLEFENEKSRNELSLLKAQINNLTLDLESHKNEIYNHKQLLQDKSQKEMQFSLAIEKANMETNQFKALLARTEKNLSDQREINQNLVKKLSDLAKERSGGIKNSPMMMKNFNEQASPSTFISVSKGMSNEKAPKLDDFSQNQQEYYLPQNKWVQPRSNQPQERNLSTDIALSSGNNRSGLPKPGNLNTNAKLNQDYSYNNDNSRIKAKKYENSGNILEWQENIVPQNIRNQKNLNFNEKSFESNKNYEREAKKYETPKPNDYYEKNLNESKLQGQSQNRDSKNKERNEQITVTNPAVSNKFQKAVPLPESRERFTKTSDQEYQNTMNTIKNIEKNLMMAQMQKEKLENDMRKLEESRTKSAANIRRKGEIDDELKILSANISHLKNKLREMNALHFY